VFDIRSVRAIAATADLQNFRARDAFRIRQVRTRYQGATQRDRVHHAQNAAERADQERDPEWKLSPPPNHDQTWQHEDDRRERARRGRNGLHNVVFLNGRIPETAQDRHRNYRRRNRRRKGKTGLETEVHIGRSEHQRDDDSYDDPADGEFLAHIRCDVGRSTRAEDSVESPERSRRPSARRIRISKCL